MKEVTKLRPQGTVSAFLRWVPVEAVKRALDAPTAAFFGGLSRIRSRRIFHPHGVGFAATMTPVRSRVIGAELFDSDDPRPALVRLSRSVGLPERLRDPCGLGIRVPDAYGPGRSQDLLMVTSALPAGARHLIVPARGFSHRPYSTLLPYRANGTLRLLGAVAIDGAPGPNLAALREREVGGLTFKLLAATLRGGWKPVADLELELRLPDGITEGLRLDPGNTGGGLELAGLLNRLRLPAYRGSQEGRGAEVEFPRSRPRLIEREGPPASAA